MKLYVADRETGIFIEEVETITEGKDLIVQYEADDKKDEIYEEGFYCIVNENHELVEG